MIYTCLLSEQNIPATDWIVAISTIFILVATIFYVYYTKQYLKATKKIMKTSAESLKFSRESFLVKEKPFVLIVDFKDTDRVRRHTEQGEDGKTVWYDVKTITFENTGTVVAKITNVNIDVKTIKYPNEDIRVDWNAEPKEIPTLIISMSENMFLAPGQERKFDFGANFDSSRSWDCVGYIADIIVNVDYEGINEDSYRYSYKGRYSAQGNDFIRLTEDYKHTTQDIADETQA